jgi:glycosyltransferase involved in cell wall biosynthesis
MKHHKLRFSIVIPCYNEEQFISRTLASLEQQTYTGKYEIIVVDNGCTDKTAAIAQSYGVKVVRECHPGVCWARQAGTKAAQGEIVISTDADTVQPKTWLQTIDSTFRRNDAYVAVAGPCAYSDGPWWGKQYPKILFGTVSGIARLTGRPFYITATNIAFKKSAWKQYHTELTQGGDELALLHDLKRNGQILFDNDNPVYTSGRRLERGLVYNIFVTFLLYYLIAYYVNQFFGRRIIGTYPAFRGSKTPRNRNRRAILYKYTAIFLIVAVIHFPGHDTLLEQSYETLAEVAHALK